MSVAMKSKPRSERLKVHVEKATLHDVSGIHAVLLGNKKDPGLLQRSRLEIQRNIRDYMIATDEDGRLLGCVAVQFHTPKIAEVWSLAVNQTYQGKGIGPRLMEAAQAAFAASQGEQLFLRTTNAEWFQRLGYKRMSKYKLPKSVLWSHFKQVFKQPAGRWVPNLLGRFKYMQPAG